MTTPKLPSDLRPELGSNATPRPDGGAHETIYDSLRREHMSWDTNPDGTLVPGSLHIRGHGPEGPFTLYPPGPIGPFGG